jgi:hypothetical protein
MNIDRKVFVKRLLIASVCIVAVGIYPLLKAAEGDGRVILSAAIGFGISVANVIAAYSLIVRSLGRSPQLFNVTVFGSMLVRMFAILALVWFFISYVELPAVSLVASLFGSYLVFMVVEIQLLLKSTNTKAKV